MIRRRLVAAFGAVLLVSMFAATPAFAQDETPGEQLGGYDALSSAAAFSLQPFLPAFVSTGDVPFEVTIALANSRIRSGGGAYGRGAAAWAGSALGDFGPIIGILFGQEAIGSLVPKWPLQAQATQDDGEVTTGAPPGVGMRAIGQSDRGYGDFRVADVNAPNVLHIEHVASTSDSTVLDGSVTSISRVALHGVSLLGGHITVEHVRSISRTTSTGAAASSSGDVDITGLKIGGIDVSVTDEGFRVEGAPGEGDAFPGRSPEEAVNELLKSLGVRVTLFKSITAGGGGIAQHFEPGVIVSIDNPVGGQRPIPPGRFDIFLASSSSQSQATLPFDADRPGAAVLGGGEDRPVETEGGGSISIGSGPRVGEGEVSDVAGDLAESAGGPGLVGGPAPNFLGDATPQRGDYKFDGVPIGLMLGLLVVAALVARYVRNLFRGMLTPQAAESVAERVEAGV